MGALIGTWVAALAVILIVRNSGSRSLTGWARMLVWLGSAAAYVGSLVVMYEVIGRFRPVMIPIALTVGTAVDYAVARTVRNQQRTTSAVPRAADAPDLSRRPGLAA